MKYKPQGIYLAQTASARGLVFLGLVEQKDVVAVLPKGFAKSLV